MGQNRLRAECQFHQTDADGTIPVITGSLYGECVAEAVARIGLVQLKLCTAATTDRTAHDCVGTIDQRMLHFRKRIPIGAALILIDSGETAS